MPRPPHPNRQSGARRPPSLPTILIALFFGTLACSADPADPEASADPQYQEFLKVNYVFNRQLYELCIPRYEKILEAKPGAALDPLVRYALGLCHYHLALKAGGGAEGPSPVAAMTGGSRPPAAGDPAASQAHARKALGYLKEAIRDRKLPSRASATLTLGQTLLLLGEHSSAATAFQYVVERSPGPDETRTALSGLADARYLSGDFAAAAAAYRRILEGGPDERAEFYLGMSLYRVLEKQAAAGGDLDEDAARECERVFAAVSSRSTSGLSADAAYMMALLREKMGDLDGAAESFRRLAGRGDGEPAELGRFGLAGALARAGKHREAAEEWRKFLESHPRSARREQAALYRATSLLEIGEEAEAMRALEALRRSAAVGIDAALLLARRKSARGGDAAGAAKLLEEALASSAGSPRRDELELELAAARIEAGETEAALEVLGRPGFAKGREDQAAYLTAHALHRARDWPGAIAACEAFGKAHPKSPFLDQVRQILAESQFLSGDYAAARSTYESCLARPADAADPARALRLRFRSAQCLYFAGKYSEARPALLAVAKSAGADDAAGRDPVLATLWLLAADCAYQTADHAAAAKEFRRFVDLAAGSPAASEALRKDLAEARFKLAHSLQLSGDAALAEEAYRAALRDDPAGPRTLQVRFELGQIAFARKDLAAARELFEEVTKAEGDDRLVPHALRYLGWIAFQEGNPALAAERYAALVKAFPEHPLAPEAEYELAASLQAAGKAAEAARVLEAFAAKHPGDPRLAKAKLREAEILARAKKPTEALGILEALRDSPDGAPILAQVLYEIAWCHRALAQPEPAIESYRKILSLPDAGGLGGAVRLELAELEFEKGAYAEAKGLLEPIVKESPSEKALYRLAWCHHYLGEHESAISTQARFAEAFPRSPLADELAMVAARSHLALGRADRAEALFRKVAEGPPGAETTRIALVSLGECLAEAGKHRDAAERFEAFLAAGSDGELAARARFGLGWARENLGELDRAIELYRGVVKDSKTVLAARAQFQIGQCLAARKEYGDAIVEFLQVPAGFESPEWSSRALLQAAGCFETLGDAANAGKYYQEVVESYPGRDEAKLASERLAKLQRS